MGSERMLRESAVVELLEMPRLLRPRQAVFACLLKIAASEGKQSRPRQARVM